MKQLLEKMKKTIDGNKVEINSAFNTIEGCEMIEENGREIQNANDDAYYCFHHNNTIEPLYNWLDNYQKIKDVCEKFAPATTKMVLEDYVKNNDIIFLNNPNYADNPYMENNFKLLDHLYDALNDDFDTLDTIIKDKIKETVPKAFLTLMEKKDIYHTMKLSLFEKISEPFFSDKLDFYPFLLIKDDNALKLHLEVSKIVAFSESRIPERLKQQNLFSDLKNLPDEQKRELLDNYLNNAFHLKVFNTVIRVFTEIEYPIDDELNKKICKIALNRDYRYSDSLNNNSTYDNYEIFREKHNKHMLILKAVKEANPGNNNSSTEFKL